MIPQRFIKRVCVILILVCFVVMAVKSFLEPRHSMEIASNTLRGYFEYFATIDFETDTPYNASDLELSVLKDELSNTDAVSISVEKPSAILKCGYDSCPSGKPGFLNVHLVPHSHDDLGYQSTMDQYYYGEEEIVGVVKVIDSIVEGLKDNPYRKFIFVEIAFFQKWWHAQNESYREVVKNLVANGQLEFINGGWCMNDEAVTHYVDIIDQMSLGSNFLNETFGECGRPKVGWQIDTFGHSKEHASILAQMGFDGMFLWRLHEEERKERRKCKSLEFVWNTNSNLGVDGKLFTGVLYDGYDPPPYLCWRKDHFEETFVEHFLYDLKEHAQAYRTSDIMVPVGTDFRIREDFTCFVPTDKLIEHTNKLQDTGSKVNLFYSTPSCYLKALHEHSNVTWPSKTDDMLPYLNYGFGIDNSPKDQEYWTGFYTSRPAFKHMVRVGSNLLQSCKQMASYLSMKSTAFVGDISSVLKQAMGVMQHHDAVTGSAKQFVIDDYIRILYQGFEECYKIQKSYYQKELPKTNASLITPALKVYPCNLNMSQCEISENSERFIVNVYNSLASFVNKYVRIPVMNQAYQILDPSGETIMFDMMPIPEFVRRLPGRNSSATHELVFLANLLPPLGSKSYHIELDKKSSVSEVNIERNEKFIENERVMVRLNETTGLIQSISLDGGKLDVEQEILWYAAREPQLKNYTKSAMRRGSGLYIFRPNQTSPFPARKQGGVSILIYKGKLVQEIHQQYNDWVGQVIRLYKGQDHVELDWVVGPIDVEDNVGKEVVNRITTKLSTDKEFYTDENGRQILKRRVGVYGESLKFDINEPVAANYYPINAHISIKDKSADKQLTLLVDRAQGGSSLDDGLLELMIHRRHVNHGNNELNEILNETAHGVGLAVRGTHFLLLSNISESIKLTRSLSFQMYKQPQISFIPTSLSFGEWSKSYNMEVSILIEGLPWNAHLLTMEKRYDGKYLLRLEHPFGGGEDPELSRNVVVNLKKSFFNGYFITSAEETMLGGNILKKDLKRFVWKESNTTKQNNKLSRINTAVDIENITLQPMQIRSFILSIEKN